MTTDPPSEYGRAGTPGADADEACPGTRRCKVRDRLVDEGHCLFVYSPVSLWDEDLSEVKKAIHRLAAEGVSDLNAYFLEHPEEADRCSRMTKVLDVNDATLQLFGAESKEQLLDNLDFVLGASPAVLGRLAPNILCIAGMETHCDGELTAQTLQGETLHLRYFWNVALAQAHDYSRVCFSLLDVTAQKKAEEALRQSEERFRSIVHSSPMGIHTYLMDSTDSLILTGANPAANDMLGIEHLPLIGKAIEEALAGLRGGDIPEKFRQVCRTGVPCYVEEIRYEHNGVTGVFELHAFRTAPGAMAVMFTSISSRKEADRQRHDLEDKMRHTQKMEAIGELAGGIAHDFNNLLMAVQGNAELLQLCTQTGSEEAELASQILTASTQAADLTRQLLAFARKGPRPALPVDLHAVIGEVAQLLRRGIDPGIEVVADLQAKTATLVGDPSMLQTTFMSLGLNARDAMPGGGRLTFATRNVDSLPADLNSDAGPPDARWIEILVADTGAGIPEAIQDRVYEPFFTTKAMGHGTGLGLAGVYGCVRTHGGTIDLESQPGEGTTFRIVLPVTEPATTPVPVPGRGAMVAGEGKVLLVDDEKSVLAFTRKSLERLGYTVTAYDDSSEAVRYYMKNHFDIDLIILDLIMPGLSGAEAFREIRRINPMAKVLLASGYTRDAATERLLSEGAAGFIGKPYSIKDLSREVHRHVQGVAS